MNALAVTPVATRRRRILVASVWAAATFAAIAFVLTMLGIEGEPDVAFALLLVILAADVMVYASVGAVLALRRPGNQIASVLLAAAMLLAATFLGFLYGASTTLTTRPADPLGGIASIVGGLTLFPALVMAGPALALVFPDGHLPGPSMAMGGRPDRGRDDARAGADRGSPGAGQRRPGR